MMDDSTLSIEYLYECFQPKFMEGKIYWKIRPRKHFPTERGMRSTNTKFANKEAGSAYSVVGGRNKYLAVGINAKTHLAHRIIWAMFYGFWPDEVDHVNGNGLDNRIINLRGCDRQENAKNLCTPKNNTSGRIGVYPDKRYGTWFAQIKVRGEIIYLGNYKDFEGAVAAREQAEEKYGFHENHGRHKIEG